MLAGDVGYVEVPVALEHRWLPIHDDSPVRDALIEHDNACRIDVRRLEDLAGDRYAGRSRVVARSTSLGRASRPSANPTAAAQSFQLMTGRLAHRGSGTAGRDDGPLANPRSFRTAWPANLDQSRRAHRLVEGVATRVCAAARQKYWTSSHTDGRLAVGVATTCPPRAPDRRRQLDLAGLARQPDAGEVGVLPNVGSEALHLRDGAVQDGPLIDHEAG